MDVSSGVFKVQGTLRLHMFENIRLKLHSQVETSFHENNWQGTYKNPLHSLVNCLLSVPQTVHSNLTLLLGMEHNSEGTNKHAKLGR
jgi:hypothetical protein